MSDDDDWKAKLKRGEPLALKQPLNTELLVEIGIDPDEAQRVLEALRQKGRKTWGSVLDLDDREEAIKLTGGDVVSGKRIWSVVQEQKAKGAGNAAAAAASKLNELKEEKKESLTSICCCRFEEAINSSFR